MKLNVVKANSPEVSSMYEKSARPTSSGLLYRLAVTAHGLGPRLSAGRHAVPEILTFVQPPLDLCWVGWPIVHDISLAGIVRRLPARYRVIYL